MKIAQFFQRSSAMTAGFALLMGASVPMGAQAQLGGLFGSAKIDFSVLQQPVRADLPPCPPLINGVPEFSLPNGEAWEPGINCAAQPAAQTNTQANAPAGDAPQTTQTTQANGQPTDTLNPGANPPAQTPSEPSAPSNPLAGSSGSVQGLSDSSAGGAGSPGSTDSTSSAGSSTNTQPAAPGEVPQTSLPGSNGSAQRVGDSSTGVQNAEANLGGLQGRVGLSYVAWPDYIGASSGARRPALLVDLTWGPKIFLNNEDGLGYRIFEAGQIESKLSLNYNGAQVFEGQTAGLSEEGNHFSAELDLVYRTAAVDYEIELGVPLGGYGGWTLTGSAGQSGALGSMGSWSARLGATYASKNWMQGYYGISAGESAASGLAAYSPKGGMRDVFLEATADVPLGANWGLDLGLGVRRTLGPATSAPQVEIAGHPTDYLGHVGFYYRF